MLRQPTRIELKVEDVSEYKKFLAKGRRGTCCRRRQVQAEQVLKAPMTASEKGGISGLGCRNNTFNFLLRLFIYFFIFQF